MKQYKKNKMSDETKYNLKIGFGSLISNQCAIDAGKNLPWWIALIIFLVGTFLGVIPSMVSIANTNGENFISGTYNYSIDRELAMTSVSLYNEGKEFVIKNKYLTYSNDNNTPSQEIYTYINPTNNQYDIRAFYLKEVDGSNINDTFNNIANQVFIQGSTTLKSDTDPSDTKYYFPTLLGFYDGGVVIRSVKYNTTTAANTFNGNFEAVADTDHLITDLATVGTSPIPTDPNDVNFTTSYVAGCYSNWKTFCNVSYSEIKSRSLIMTTFIYWGVYAALTLFLGLLMFLLTRGKRNFNNYLKWYQCLQISAWTALSPGILAMLLGFLLTQFAIMFFIIFMGIRTMWLTMKQLSPNYQNSK